MPDKYRSVETTFIDTIVDHLDRAYPDSDHYWTFIPLAGTLWKCYSIHYNSPLYAHFDVLSFRNHNHAMNSLLDLEPMELLQLAEACWRWLLTEGHMAISQFRLLDSVPRWPQRIPQQVMSISDGYTAYSLTDDPLAPTYHEMKLKIKSIDQKSFAQWMGYDDGSSVDGDPLPFTDNE